jgi:endoglycosylceramidase
MTYNALVRGFTATCIALVACSAAPHRTTPLASDGTHLRDAEGRIALLRGVNARVAGVFDVTFSDGRNPVEMIPPLDDTDCARMRALGFDLLRLPIDWSAIEPAPGAYDEAYLDRVDATVQCAARAGLYVLVDLHQDGYSKEIGEDGAPLWAIQPPPTMLLQGPLTDLSSRRVSPQVVAAFATLFDRSDPAQLQTRYCAMAAHVAARWAAEPTVIGFELFNEPVAGEADVDAFHARIGACVRPAAPDKLVVFEPSATRNLFDFVPLAKAKFPVANAVYAPHIYTFVFFSNPAPLQNLAPADLESSVSGARDEASAWHVPLLITEFGIGPGTTNADLWMAVEAQLHDKYLASDAFWVWKEYGGWGVYDPPGATWTERAQIVAWISRVHAARIAGDVVANDYDYTTGALRLEVKHGTTHGTPHVIYVPERAAATFAVACNGTPLATARDAPTGLVSVACDGVLVVQP